MSEYMYLAHHGVKGQKHGYRQWQNPDGSLTPAGRIHYGVGAARKAVKAVGKVVKKTADNLSSARRESVKVSKERKEKRRIAKEEATKARFEHEQRKRQERIDARSRELIANASKMKLKDLNRKISELDLVRRKERVDALIAKQERIKLKADLKAQERSLRKSMLGLKKEAKANARKKYSKRDISRLTDDELKARTSRLEAEIKLRGLEADRAAPKMSATAKWLSDVAKQGGSEGAKKLAGALAVKYGEQVLGLTEQDIAEYIKLTKKK